MRKTTKQQGFTLIELMIVVAVIGVLAAVAFPAYQDYVKKGEAASGLATLKSLITPAEMIYQDLGVLSGGIDVATNLGISGGANTLGEIEIPSDDRITFTFGAGSLKDEVITLDREDYGWECSKTFSTPELKGCG